MGKSSALAAAVTLAVACGGGGGSPPASGLGDAGPIEAGPRADGGSQGGQKLCKESAPRFSAPFRADGRGFDLAVDKLAVHLVYTESACGAATGAATGHRLRYAAFETAGDVPAPATLNVVADGLCAKVRDPRIVLTRKGDAVAPELRFLSTRDGAWEAFRAGTTDDSIERLSDAADDFVARELAAGLDGAGLPLAAVAEQRPAGDALLAYHAGTTATWLAPELGLEVRALALGARTRDGSRLPLAVFVAESDAAGLYVLPLGEDGSAPPLPTPLPAQPGGDPVLSVAPGLEGGALVYTEGATGSDELRFLALDADGAPSGRERKLTTSNERARDPSVAPFVTGYAIAFRALLADAPERATLRLAFVDAGGNLAGFRDVVETSSAGGPLVLRVANDGRLVIGFAEVDAAGESTLHVARVTCASQ